MTRLPTQRWTVDDKTYSVALVVEGAEVVGITPVKMVVPKGCHDCNSEPEPEVANASS